jgi:hypothetical protein
MQGKLDGSRGFVVLMFAGAIATLAGCSKADAYGAPAPSSSAATTASWSDAKSPEQADTSNQLTDRDIRPASADQRTTSSDNLWFMRGQTGATQARTDIPQSPPPERIEPIRTQPPPQQIVPVAPNPPRLGRPRGWRERRGCE